MHSNLFIHTHKGSLIKDLMVKPVLMKMYKQIRKCNFLKYLLKVETLFRSKVCEHFFLS